MKRIILLVCILSGLAALAPPPAAGQGAGDFGSGWGTRFIYRRPFRYDIDTTLLDQRYVRGLDSSCFKTFAVPLGHWSATWVERSEPTTSLQCDTVWSYPLPFIRDTSFARLSRGLMSDLQLELFATKGIYRDTVRIGGSDPTITFVRYAGTQGDYIGNMKERTATYAHRIGKQDSLYGKDWLGCDVLKGCGGYGATPDTIVLPARMVISRLLAPGWSQHWHRYTFLDTTRQTVTNPAKYRNDPLLEFTLTNCHDRPDIRRWLAPEKVWIAAGRDTLLAIDTCKIPCPRFTVDGDTIRVDSTCRWDTTYTDTPIIQSDTNTIYGCIQQWSIPVNFAAYAVMREFNTIGKLRYDSLKAIYGDTNVTGGRPLLDSVLTRWYDAFGTPIGEVKLEPGIVSGLPERNFQCSPDSIIGAAPPGWRLVDSSYFVQQARWAAYYEKTAWLPYTALMDGQPPCGEQVVVYPTRYGLVTGSCCSHDSTVIFYRPSISDPTQMIAGTHTFKVPDGAVCDYTTIRNTVVGYEIDSISWECEYTQTQLDMPAYHVTVRDSCDCNPADATIEAINGTVTLCTGIRVVSECGVRQPYWGADGRTLIIPCEDHQVTINGRRSNSFADIATHTDITLLYLTLKAIADSLGARCPPCVDSLLARVNDIESRLDSLEGRVTDLEAKQPICGTAAFDPSGEYVISGLSEAPKNVTITYTQGGGTIVPYSEWAGGNLILRGTPEIPINYCYWP